MILPCSIKWPDKMGELAGKPTHFPEKIWNALIDDKLGVSPEIMAEYLFDFDQIGYAYSAAAYTLPSKPHSIREDKHDRWKAGQLIHFYINNRTKNMFQFAPAIYCVSIQSFEVFYYPFENGTRTIQVCIGLEDGMRSIKLAEQDENGFVNKWWDESDSLERLAINDGFPGLSDFFRWFDTDFKGKIIHWTDLRYQ